MSRSMLLRMCFYIALFNSTTLSPVMPVDSRSKPTANESHAVRILYHIQCRSMVLFHYTAVKFLFLLSSFHPQAWEVKRSPCYKRPF